MSKSDEPVCSAFRPSSPPLESKLQPAPATSCEDSYPSLVPSRFATWSRPKGGSSNAPFSRSGFP